VPREWRVGIIVPIPKAGKDPSKIESYRPVTLTSCLAKLAERMVRERFMFDLESNNKLSYTQSGFRSRRCTTDPITRLVEDVSNGFQKSKPHERTLAVLVDFARAFDKVDHEQLHYVLVQMKIPKRICQWMHSFLEDRRATCKVGKEYSRQRKFQTGVPQGSVTGPILFTCYIDTLAKELEKIEGLRAGMFADDLTIWNSNVEATVARNKVQEGISVIETWCKE